jgi:hypothetical protein
VNEELGSHDPVETGKTSFNKEKFLICAISSSLTTIRPTQDSKLSMQLPTWRDPRSKVQLGVVYYTLMLFQTSTLSCSVGGNQLLFTTLQVSDALSPCPVGGNQLQ